MGIAIFIIIGIITLLSLSFLMLSWQFKVSYEYRLYRLKQHWSFEVSLNHPWNAIISKLYVSPGLVFGHGQYFKRLVKGQWPTDCNFCSAWSKLNTKIGLHTHPPPQTVLTLHIPNDQERIDIPSWTQNHRDLYYFFFIFFCSHLQLGFTKDTLIINLTYNNSQQPKINPHTDSACSHFSVDCFCYPGCHFLFTKRHFIFNI